MKRSNQILSAAVSAFLLFAVLHIIGPAAAEARSAVAIEGARFETAASIKDNLQAWMGKDVLIHLRSGKTLQGYVKSVGEHLVHLEKISGRDFYDALIRMEDITVVEGRFREMR